MLLSRKAATLLLNETKGFLKSAGEDVFKKEIESIELMIKRINDERWDDVSIARIYSHLIMWTKNNSK